MKQERLQKIRVSCLERYGIDALLVSQPENRRYASGFTGSDGWLLISREEALILVDFRYTEQAKRESPEFEIAHVKGDYTTCLLQVASDLKCMTLGFEAEGMNFSVQKKLVDSIKTNFPDKKLIPVDNVIASIRSIKDEQELCSILQACKLVDNTYAYAKSIIQKGMKEKELAWILEKHLRESGSEVIPFDIIVATGINAALPHVKVSEQVITTGQPIVIDMGAKVNGYCSDFTRTLYIGLENDRFKRIYDIVLGSQLAALSTIVAGLSCPDADRIPRTIIEKAGYAEYFGHGLGHGVGLAVHEKPSVSQLSQDTLEENMVFTVEPGIYIPGWGGVRIEDTVVIEKGRVRSLTIADKNAILN